MKPIKALVCCTFGAGSSMILKANLDQIFRKIGQAVDIEVTDIGSVSGRNVDVVFTSKSLVQQVSENVGNSAIKIIPIKDYFDFQGMETDVRLYLDEVKDQ